VLTIEDAGKGMPGIRGVHQLVGQKDAPTRGVGLASMRERLQQIGGRLEIDSGGGRTTVKAVVPVRGQPRGGYTFPQGVQEIFLLTACPPSGLLIEWSRGYLAKARIKCSAEHRSLALLQTNNQAPRRTGQPRPSKVIQGFLNEFRQEGRGGHT